MIAKYNQSEGIRGEACKELKISSYESSTPKTSFAFVKFASSDERTPQDHGNNFRNWLREQRAIPTNSKEGEGVVWSAPCRPEHERQTRSVLNQARAHLHILREKTLGLPKEYSFCEEASEIIGGSYKEGRECVTWRDRIIATLADPGGAKTVHWNIAAILDVVGADFRTRGIEFNETIFSNGWKEFQSQGEKNRQKQF